MGLHLTVYRLPLDWAVDTLTGRRPFLDWEDEDPTRQIVSYMDPVETTPPTGLRFYGGFRMAMALLDGGTRDWNRFDDEWHRERRDPAKWGVIGTRLSGVVVLDLPYRYSLPDDARVAADAVQGVMPSTLRSRVEAFVPPDSPEDLQWWGEHMTPFLLDTLPVFLRAASEAGEVVVHWVH